MFHLAPGVVAPIDMYYETKQFWIFGYVLFWSNPCFCRLYRSLGDYDVVRGIFGGKIGTKAITCAALQAEAKSDYAEAVKLYNEVTSHFYCLGFHDM